MSDRDRYQEHLDAFGRALGDAARDHRALRPVVGRRPLAAVVGLAVVAAVALAVLLASPGSRSVDVLGRAQAALTTGGELVHYLVRESSGPSTGSGIDLRVAREACRKTGPIEAWWTANPVRWRVVRPALVRTPGCRDRPGSEADLALGEQHYAFADGTMTQYTPANDELTVTRGYGNGRGDSEALSGGMFPTSSGAAEPLVVVQRMLRKGMLLEEGERTVNGRAVRTLSRTTEQHLEVGGRRTAWDEVTVYDVDAGTFAPVRIVRSYVMPIVRGSGKDLRVAGLRPRAMQFDFELYERLPLDRSTRGLLTIDSPHGERVRSSNP